MDEQDMERERRMIAERERRTQQWQDAKRADAILHARIAELESREERS